MAVWSATVMGSTPTAGTADCMVACAAAAKADGPRVAKMACRAAFAWAGENVAEAASCADDETLWRSGGFSAD